MNNVKVYSNFWKGCVDLFQMQYDASKMLPTLNNFDKKVTEADAYLQLLIEQVKVSIFCVIRS